MNSESTIRNFHAEIVRVASETLARSLTEKEARFVTSRSGLIALETVLDTVKAGDEKQVEEYLNSG